MIFHTIGECVCCGGKDLQSSPTIIAPFIVRRLFGVKVSDEFEFPSHSLTCNYCGCRFLEIRYTDEQLEAIYKDYRGKDYVATREEYEPNYGVLNDWLSAGVPYMREIEALLEPHLTFPVSILDWGGDTGQNAPFADRRKSLHVYDIGNSPVIPGAVKVSKDIARSIHPDLVVCSNVLEHVPYPGTVLTDIAEVMDKNTILFIEVPVDGITRDGWHEHINLFTGMGISILLDRCGLVGMGWVICGVPSPGGVLQAALITAKRKDAQ